MGSIVEAAIYEYIGKFFLIFVVVPVGIMVLGYIIFVFPIIIAQTYVRLSLEHYVPVDSNGEI